MSYLTSDDADRAIAFYKTAFGAEELFRLVTREGRIGHAEVRIGELVLMIGDEFPGMNTSPKTLGGRTSQMALMVDDVDAVYNKALAAGGIGIRPPANEFYGYRMAIVLDPGGQLWMIQREIEKIAPEEMQRRWDAMLAQSPEGSPCSESKS